MWKHGHVASRRVLQLAGEGLCGRDGYCRRVTATGFSVSGEFDSRVSRSAKEKPLMLHAVLYQPSYKAGTEPAVYGF
jgi:hypothetical protein